MPLLYVEDPDSPGLALVDAADPTGNGNDTVQIVFKDDRGDYVSSGLFIQRHAGGKLRALHGNADSAAEDNFEMTAGRVSIVEL
jgi:hypothetical protein